MKPIRNLRTRQRSDGSIRVWWEPRTEDRALGFAVVELDSERMRWSRDQAEKLNAQVEIARAGGARKPSARGRSIMDLILDYRQTIHWTETLKPKTRQSYTRLLDVIEKKWGAQRAAEFDRATMDTWYETLYRARGPRMAQALLRMFSILMEHAERKGWRAENTNPCLKLRLKTPEPRARWLTQAEVAAILDAATHLGRHAMRLAILMSLLHGQRQTDVREARRQDFRLLPYLPPGADQPVMRLSWVFTRSKRGNAAAIGIHAQALPDLRAALADTGTATAPRLADAPLILDEVTGKAYSEDLLIKRWRAIVAHAAAATGGNCASLRRDPPQFRDLRRTFSTWADMAGMGLSEIGDTLGNSMAANQTLAQTYIPPSFDAANRTVDAIQLTPKKKGPAQ